jgi:alpha-amylase
MKTEFRYFVHIVVVVVLLFPFCVLAQSGFDDDRVMLQGFYWESYRHGHPERFPEYGIKRWYEIVQEKAGDIRAGRFDLIWLPPVSYSGEYSAGYNPKEYFNLNNSYGTQEQHLNMLKTLLENGVEPIADIVINHRDGSGGWATFQNPQWGTEAICRNDEAFYMDGSEVKDTPVDQRGSEEEHPEYAGHSGTTYQYPDFRDIDHTNPIVRKDVIRYLKLLQSAGYRGWRYDMVHGFHARWIAVYNRETEPTFSVGEYEWSQQAGQRGWVWHTATEPGKLRTASNVFDFSTYFSLKNNKGNYTAWHGQGLGLGLVGDTTDNYIWKNRAVTFLENHDTGYRTKEDGTPEKDHYYDSFGNNWEVEQAYAYILTHPGIPCVYWKHYFDWGSDLQSKIKALINARKVADVHSGCAMHTQHNARERGVYAAMIEGRKGQLYVRIGGSDYEWQPGYSNYSGYREYARGAGWKVWISLPNSPDYQKAPLNTPIPMNISLKLPDRDDITDAMIQY